MTTVLLFRFSALGDVAMTVPALYDACLANPSTRFVMVTQGAGSRLFAERPANLEVVAVNLRQYPGPAGMLRLWRRLRREWEPDMVLDLHDVLRTKLLRLFARLSGLRVRSIHKGRAGKRALTRAHHKILVPQKSGHERYRDVLRRAGISAPERFAGFRFAAMPEALRLPAGRKRLAVAPFAQHAGKIYPPELTEKVVAAISAMPGWEVVLFGGGDKEMAVFERWTARYDGVVTAAELIGRAGDLAPLRSPMEAEMAIMSGCEAMLSMDSANMHLASLAGTRTVSIWGATHPYTGFMGWRQREEDAVQLPMACRPCSVFGNRPCRLGAERRGPDDCPCLSQIPPAMVIDRILKQ